MNRLYIAAKAPRPGFVKTRLGRSIGQLPAARLYAAFLRDLANRFAPAAYPTGWFVTPDDAGSEIAAASGDWSGAVLGQGSGDWGRRQDRLFATAAQRGESALVLIASDSPQVPEAEVARAFRLLEVNDLVLGPVLDGGYWLIGMSGYHDILRGAAMSTGDAMAGLIGKAAGRGLSVALVASTFDIDEAADLPALEAACARRDDLAATAAALTELRVRS